jgi:hypothetical protein
MRKEITRDVFDAWFGDAWPTAIDLAAGTVTMSIDTLFRKHWIEENMQTPPDPFLADGTRRLNQDCRIGGARQSSRIASNALWWAITERLREIVWY